MAILPAFWRIDEFVKAANGYAMANGQVFFCTQPANTVAFPPSPLAQLYADPFGLTPISQPVVCDGYGHVGAYVAAGTYTMVVALSNVIQNVYPDQSYGISSAQVLFETNGVPNANQSVLNIVGAGDVTVFTNALGQTVVESTGFVLPGTGTGNLVVTAFAGFNVAPAGSVIQADGNGNAANSGVLVSSLATVVALAAETSRAEAAEAGITASAVLKSPSADQTVTADNLLPASANTTQSLGLSTARWNALLGTADIKSINKIVNAADFPGSPDIGLQVQNAIAALPSAGGTVYIPAGSYTQASTIILPRYVLLQGASAFGTQLTYTGAGWAVIIADSSGGGNYPEGGIADISFAGPGTTTGTGGIYFGGSDGVIAGSGTVNTSGTAVVSESGTGFSTATWTAGTIIIIQGVAYLIASTNSSSSITLQTSGAGIQTGVSYLVVASPSTASDPASNYGDHVNLNRVCVGGNSTGFTIGVQFGDNTFSTSLTQCLIDGNNVGVASGGQIFYNGSGEGFDFLETGIQNNLSIGVIDNYGAEMYFTMCHFDYNQASPYTNYTGLSVLVAGGDCTFMGCHFEKYSGDQMLLTGGGTIHIYGGVMVNTIGTTTSNELINIESNTTASLYVYGLDTNYALGQTVNYFAYSGASCTGNLVLEGIGIGLPYTLGLFTGIMGTEAILGNGQFTLTGIPLNGIVFRPTGNVAGSAEIIGTNAAGTPIWEIDQPGNATFSTLTVGQATPTGSLSGVAFGDTTTSSASTTGAIALPAHPAGFLSINIGGTVYKLPYYAS